MNILTSLRKPQFALFLAAILLFTACSQDADLNFDNDTNQISPEQTVKKHIALTDKLSSIFRNQDNIDVNLLENSKNIKNEEELARVLTNANIKNVDEVISLLNQVQLNLNSYLEEPISHKKMNTEDITAMVTNEILRQSEINDTVNYKNGGPCETALMRSEGRCNRNYSISMAGVVISGFFSLGVGTVIGGVAATGVMALCMEDAASDYGTCRDGDGSEDGEVSLPTHGN